MKTKKLLPCPFCGIKPKLTDGDYYIAHKSGCMLRAVEWLVGAIEIHRWNTRPSNWTSIDELPNEKGYYLVHAYYETKEAFWNGKKWHSAEDYKEAIDGDTTPIYVCLNVIHWQPLPELTEGI